MASRRALLRHIWSMMQTRAEAAALVLKLQRSSLMQGAALYAVAAFAAMSFVTAFIVLIAVAAPPEWRVLALTVVAAALLATAVVGAVAASRKLRRDEGLIADFTRGLRLDLALVNLALKDPDTEDEEKIEARERAKQSVREAAADKAAAPSTAEGGGAPSPEGPAMAAAAAAMHAASAPRPGTPQDDVAGEAIVREGAATPSTVSGGVYASSSRETNDRVSPDAGGDLPQGVTEREVPEASATPPDSITTRHDREHSLHGRA